MAKFCRPLLVLTLPGRPYSETELTKHDKRVSALLLFVQLHITGKRLTDCIRNDFFFLKCFNMTAKTKIFQYSFIVEEKVHIAEIPFPSIYFFMCMQSPNNRVTLHINVQSLREIG